MTTRVRVITGDVPALVLSYPRDADPVFGADFTEVAQMPPHFEQEFTLNSGIDLLVAEMPAPAAAGQVPTDDDVIPFTSGFADSEDAPVWPTASLREAG